MASAGTLPVNPLRACFYQSSPGHLYGGQLDMLLFLRLCDRAKIDPVVIVPGDGPFAGRCRDLGVPVHLLPLPAELARTGGALLEGSPFERSRQAARLAPWSLRLRSLLASVGANVLYANNRRAVLTVGAGARMAGVPVFWHIKQDIDRGRMDSVALCLMTSAAGCSQEVQASFRRRHPDYAGRIGFVPNGIDLDPFQANGLDLRAALEIPASALVVGLAGSITPRKGVDLFVKAALELAGRFPGVHFILAGEAPAEYAGFKGEVMKEAQPLAAAGRFHTPGYVADMPAFYRTIDVLALPSRVEGFGLVVAEAAAAGKPCVRSASGGATDTTLDGETGYIVPIEDAGALADWIGLLLVDADLRRRLGDNARVFATANFGPDRFVSGLTAALEQTAGRQQPSPILIKT